MTVTPGTYCPKCHRILGFSPTGEATCDHCDKDQPQRLTRKQHVELSDLVSRAIDPVAWTRKDIMKGRSMTLAETFACTESIYAADRVIEALTKEGWLKRS